MPFTPNKTIKELGIDVTRKFIVVGISNFYSSFNVGDVLELCADDNINWSINPYFVNQFGVKDCCYLSRLEYYDPLRYTEGMTFTSGILNTTSGNTTSTYNKPKNIIMNTIDKFKKVFQK